MSLSSRSTSAVSPSLSAQQVIDLLGLTPHPEEGGFYRETWRSEDSIKTLPASYQGPRAYGTAIYYLLTPQTFSHMHLLDSVEVFHAYAGDAVEQLQLHPDGSARVVTLGTDLAVGQVPQEIVPAGVWQGARLAPGGQWALLGCTVSPGFDFADYHHGDRADLAHRWPTLTADQRALLDILTRPVSATAQTEEGDHAGSPL